MTTTNKHWNKIFCTTIESELGWYEKDVSQTLKFLNSITLAQSARVFIVGAGTSMLVDELMLRNQQIIVNDISDEALARLRGRTGPSKKLIWLQHDISKPLPENCPNADIWIDRAVLHFLLEEADIQGYFANLKAIVRSGGYALLAQFSTKGARKCAGLDIHCYSIQEMTKRMGPEFELLKHEYYTYINPFGAPRPYIYALYKKSG
ncbi:methyltransferase domain-containing protein [Desulfonatronovibrio magnus]|uniref:methyltransferase domain-containing protein n=1 Tax=Desulfonatronovibrio magnus TaxID=698827 RepID=UPI0005EAECCE|nr:methyltransferase domain-containing protein [Desulfonatronovibrio magnus]